MFTNSEIQTILEHALIAWLWSECDDSGEPLDSLYDLSDIAEETREEWREDIEQFATLAKSALRIARNQYGATLEQIGHDFTLTRNGHGAGFWDRGYRFTGDALTMHAKSFGESHAIVGDDGQIHSF